MFIRQSRTMSVDLSFAGVQFAKEDRQIELVHSVTEVTISAVSLEAQATMVATHGDTELYRYYHSFKFTDGGYSITEQAYRSAIQRPELTGATLVV